MHLRPGQALDGLLVRENRQSLASLGADHYNVDFLAHEEVQILSGRLEFFHGDDPFGLQSDIDDRLFGRYFDHIAPDDISGPNFGGNHVHRRLGHFLFEKM
jgi:hypothetical protein